MKTVVLELSEELMGRQRAADEEVVFGSFSIGKLSSSTRGSERRNDGKSVN